jgi:hypothetical protein
VVRPVEGKMVLYTCHTPWCNDAVHRGANVAAIMTVLCVFAACINSGRCLHYMTPG